MSPITALPQIDIQIDGQPLGIDAQRWLVELRVQQRLSLPAQAEVVFQFPAGASPPGLAVVSGNEMGIDIQDSGRLFHGQVTAIEYEYEPSGGRVVRVRGYDRLHQLRKRQSLRAHADMNLAELAKSLVAEIGLHLSSATPGAKWRKLVQFRQSDFDILAEAAEFCGQYFTLRDDTVHLITLQGTGETVELTLGENLFEARIEANAESVCESVATTAWDPSRVELHRGTASRPRVGREVNVRMSADSVGAFAQRILADRSLADDRQAEQLAQGELDRRVASEVTLWGVADGDARLCPGTAVAVSGVDGNLEGRYVLTSVTHSIDDRKGFVSEFSTAPPAPRRPPRRAAVATWGIITDIKDPERMGRVQARLPTYGDIETNWMGVVTPGGGAGKGLVVIPDRGDNVLVIFANEDPAQGIVIGGLYGTHGPPDGGGIKGGSVRRYTLITPGGQLVRLDDDQQSVHLENSDGSYVELTPHRACVHATADLTLEAPGKSVYIRGHKIRFEEA
jgi:uncharacterized protein involved in type VI secretion and phage assembly